MISRAVLERIYGAGLHTITLSTPPLQEGTPQYSKVRHITRDVDDARVFGGIHLGFDQDVQRQKLRRAGASCLED